MKYAGLAQLIVEEKLKKRGLEIDQDSIEQIVNDVDMNGYRGVKIYLSIN